MLTSEQETHEEVLEEEEQRCLSGCAGALPSRWAKGAALVLNLEGPVLRVPVG